MITASNAGPSNASGLGWRHLPGTLTCTWTCGAGGGTCTASGSGNINNTGQSAVGWQCHLHRQLHLSRRRRQVTLSNTATVAAPAVTDPTPGNNSATDTDTIIAQADLAITVTDGVTTATPGGAVTYTITASNAGPSNATGATVGHLPGAAHPHRDLCRRRWRHLHRERFWATSTTRSTCPPVAV